MATIEVITKSDLMELGDLLYAKLSKLITKDQPPQFLRSAQVRDLLNISAGTLQNLRISNVLHAQKIGNIYYYNLDEINTLLSQGFNESGK
jgi:hypothetical protein